MGGGVSLSKHCAKGIIVLGEYMLVKLEEYEIEKNTGLLYLTQTFFKNALLD